MVRFENVGMRYGPGPEVLRDVTFVLEAGSFTFLTGLSGAGKTTLLKLIYLAEPPSRGLITLFGQRPRHRHARRDLPAAAPPHRRGVPGFPAARSSLGLRQCGAAAAAGGQARSTIMPTTWRSFCPGWGWATA